MDFSVKNIFDFKAIIKSMRSFCDKDSKSYKVTKYYIDLTSGILDDGGIALATAKLLSIEKELIKRIKEHPDNKLNILQPEESAMLLINDLRNRGILR